MTEVTQGAQDRSKGERLSGASLGRGITDLLLLVLAMLSLATLFAARAWLPDMLSFFRPHLFFASVVALLAALVVRRRARIALAIALVAFNVWPLMVRATPRPEALLPAEQTIRVMSMNLLYQNRRADLMRQAVAEATPDVLVLQEVAHHWPAAVAKLEGLPYRLQNPNRFSGDVAILSRFPITLIQWNDLSLLRGDHRLDGQMFARVLVDPRPSGQPFVLYAVHPQTPRTAAGWEQRGAYLDTVADIIHAEPDGMPVMVVGDWNLPPWSPLFKRFIAAARLAPADPLPWPAGTRIFKLFGLTLPRWLGTPIDRLAGSSQIAVGDFHVGQPFGSDHLPVYADVAVR